MTDIRYGWRFWGLRQDGVLLSPMAGAATSARTFEAPCRACGAAAPALDCRCGLHYLSDVERLFAGTPFVWILRPQDRSWPSPCGYRRSAWEQRVPVLLQIHEGRLGFALSYGVALGDVERDTTARSGAVYRARRWHMLALLVGAHAPKSDRSSAFSVLYATERGDSLRQLRGRYGCEVRSGASLDSCRAVEQRLASTVSAERLAELAAGPAAPLVRVSTRQAAFNALPFDVALALATHSGH